ncbi:hypothetical protein [Streptomyces olivaceus]
MTDERIDPVLAQLVRLANKSGLEFGITVTSGGLTITGCVISNEKWFDSQASAIRAASQAGSEDVGLHTVFEHWRDTVKRWGDEDSKAEEVLKDLPEDYWAAVADKRGVGFIHLTQARFFTSAGAVPSEGTFWRGHLNSIDGWFVGTLGGGA